MREKIILLFVTGTGASGANITSAYPLISRCYNKIKKGQEGKGPQQRSIGKGLRWKIGAPFVRQREER